MCRCRCVCVHVSVLGCICVRACVRASEIAEANASLLTFVRTPARAHRGIVSVLPNSIADTAGVTAGSIILKVNGESVLSFRAWSLSSVFRSVECGSLPKISPEGVALSQPETSLSLTVISHPTDPPTSAKVVDIPLPEAVVHARKAGGGLSLWPGGEKNDRAGGWPASSVVGTDGREMSTDVNPALSLEASGDSGVPPQPLSANSGGGISWGGDVGPGFSLSSLGSAGAGQKAEVLSNFLHQGAGILSQFKEHARLKDQSQSTGTDRSLPLSLFVCL